MEKYVFISGVCKYHVYQDVWKPLIGEKPLLQNLPFKSFKSMLIINTCSEPLASQVLTFHFYIGKISVEFTSSENIANNFAVEWRFIPIIIIGMLLLKQSNNVYNCLNELLKVKDYDPKPCTH